MLILDGNNVRRGKIHRAFNICQLRECILECHGNKTVNVCRRNKKNVPIDRIWISPSLEIQAGGYFEFDKVIKPQARRLHCRNLQLVDNYIRHYEAYLKKHRLTERALALEQQRSLPINDNGHKEYKDLDPLRYKGVVEAVRKCRKLRVG